MAPGRRSTEKAWEDAVIKRGPALLIIDPLNNPNLDVTLLILTGSHIRAES